jgi:hypothetical protein
MTNRITYAPQDFQKMCKQAERDHEAKKLAVLIERVKRQIAERENPEFRVDSPKPPAAAMATGPRPFHLCGPSAPFER